jgi:hypothetical protein
MLKPSPIFVIPTYRLRDVAATVEAYDDHLRRNGHSLDMVVFDESGIANQQKYYPLLEQTGTHNPLYYVGPQQKEEFWHDLVGRLRDRKLEPRRHGRVRVNPKSEAVLPCLVACHEID